MNTIQTLSRGAALALLVSATSMPAQAQSANAADLFISTVLTAELRTPLAASAAAPVADDGANASDAFVAAVLKPQLVRGGASSANAAAGEFTPAPVAAFMVAATQAR